ncbi:hypothetical protein DQ04_11461000 [Trypanosoma grayi]|uniref:hypothetical protein n=1 Tax=Trypanosoma grayi TaxID=71804 RepID=UPI0004F465ED|nr:hypothetical protein DQ04_11461000 [Trypanosoma grayi]KEG06964.1 hypothetical protein DQ04_11461000 [Trypanosoma grayi]
MRSSPLRGHNTVETEGQAYISPCCAATGINTEGFSCPESLKRKPGSEEGCCFALRQTTISLKALCTAAAAVIKNGRALCVCVYGGLCFCTPDKCRTSSHLCTSRKKKEKRNDTDQEMEEGRGA